MGWCSSREWGNKKELVTYLKNHYATSPHYSLAASSLRSNNLWCLVNERVTGLNFIVLYRLASFGKGEWGYKSIDESMGPCYYDCPKVLLTRSTYDSGYAKEWRAKCLERAGNRVRMPKLKRGMIVKLNGIPYSLEENYKTRWLVKHCANGSTVRTTSHVINSWLRHEAKEDIV